MKGEEGDIGVCIINERRGRGYRSVGGGQESSQLTISTIGKGDEKN